MKPVALTVAGLHSYRAPVSIDFEALGRYGLFGIFGPIGAGKSTILDAITLALYGLVDRVVGRSRRGLVHAGDPTVRCEVRFRFRIGTGQPADPLRTFEVHRAYRDEGGIAQRVASRLVELPAAGPPLVLAEKETEVNAAVEELVGLSSEDFLRAVVLPQGRFVQLLQLRGAERRQMLQRIFRLQAYGEDLRARVRERQTATRARQAEVRGELAGLGDASPAAVAAAVAAARAAREARDEAEQAQHALEARHDEAERRRERHRRWLVTTVALDANALDRPRMEQRAAELERAARLRPLVPALHRHDEAAGRAAEATRAAEGARAARAEATAAHAVRAAAADAARERLAAEGAERRVRLERLAAAARDEVERAAALEEAARREAEAAGHAEDERAARAEADALRVRVGELDKERRKVRRELAKKRVEPAERERVSRAARASDAVAAARRLVEEARAEELAAAGAVLIARQRVAEASAAAAEAEGRSSALAAAEPPPGPEPEPFEERARALRDAVARGQERAEGSSRAAAEHAEAEAALLRAREAEAVAGKEVTAAVQVVRGAERALAEAEDQLRAHQQRAAAFTLATTLGPGVPCAVCGSTHHPAPAGAPVGDPAPAVDAHRTGHQRAVARRERALEARAAAAAATTAAAERATAAAQRLAEARAAEGALPDAAELARAEEALAAVLAARAAREEHRRALDDARLAHERARVPVAGAEATLAAALAEAERTRELREVRAAAEGAAWAAFDQERGELTLFDVQGAVAAVEARDREAHALAERADALDHDREATARAAEDARTRADRAAAAGVRAREHLESAHRRARALGEAIAAVVGEGTAAARHAEEAAALRALEGDVESCGAAAHATAGALARATEADAAATAAATSARDEHARAAEALRADAAAVLGGDDPVAALRALAPGLPDEATAAAWAADVERWREEGRTLRNRLAELEAEGTDGALDDAAWAALQAALAAARAAVEEARDTAIGAARVADELTGRAARWTALCAASTALEAEGARLDELAHLLRGDRFVEYVADDHLQDLTARASGHLLGLSGGRYALQLDAEGAFVVRDGDLGGVVRPVTGLSGGESFLTALALALALSSLVQARSSRPLGFFFLDEGFGTLDPEALDRVLSAIEGLRAEDRLIGLISHVPEVRDRIPRYLLVRRDPGGASTVVMVDG